MLEYLVTSKVRRRLLLLLWGEGASGTVSDLAQRIDAAFASTHAELKAMERAFLVVAHRDGARDVYAANFDHPEAATLRRLVDAGRRVPSAPSAEDEAVKANLKALGAPLAGVQEARPAVADALETLVRGARLARRDPVVAKSLPVALWRQRSALHEGRLLELVSRPEDKHTLAFFLAMTAQLGRSRSLASVAEKLRDRRVTSTRPFFVQATRREPGVPFPLARKWGFTMNLSLGSFRAHFEKFESACRFGLSRSTTSR